MSRLVALLLSSNVVIVGGKWIGLVCLLGDRARKALEDPVHTVCCHAAGFEAIYLLICMEASRFGGPGPPVPFSWLAVTIEKLTRILS